VAERLPNKHHSLSSKPSTVENDVKKKKKSKGWGEVDSVTRSVQGTWVLCGHRPRPSPPGADTVMGEVSINTYTDGCYNFRFW
jgi:hypothetical protein